MRRTIEPNTDTALAWAVTAALILAATAAPAAAQRSSDADTTRLVDRIEARYADRMLVTREGDFALLLVGQDLYIQLTDRGMDEIGALDEDEMDAGLATRLLGAMLRAGVRELLDRAIVYPVSELGRAEYVEDRLVLEDHVALLGDAAHPMLPFLGQGGNQAMEDGVVLGRCFAATDDIDDALVRYEAARKERGNGVQLATRAIAEKQMSFADPRDIVFGKSPAVDYDPGTMPV